MATKKPFATHPQLDQVGAESDCFKYIVSAFVKLNCRVEVLVTAHAIPCDVTFRTTVPHPLFESNGATGFSVPDAMCRAAMSYLKLVGLVRDDGSL